MTSPVVTAVLVELILPPDPKVLFSVFCVFIQPSPAGGTRPVWALKTFHYALSNSFQPKCPMQDIFAVLFNKVLFALYKQNILTACLVYHPKNVK